ncbi:hypothetical protein [Deinococcus sp. QL22]|uniref:hypothetical protein n=1 Tax=Deinococcus sp. QL22 TaxID=2939437 RepID=UPI002016CA15|nr:hypothetical protein [Deinococcus sp. QL22]UQN10129.1 hypothetical protein M1R55_28495 [Deinococcus sp. QL22]
MADDEDVLQTAKELLERSATLQQELEQFFQREAERELGCLSSVNQSSENMDTGDDE